MLKERNALWISALYLFLGIIWIYGSDRALIILLNLQSVEELTQLQSYKGVVYVLLTTVLLFLLIRNSTNKLKASQSFYKSYFLQNPNPVWLISTEAHKFLAVNDAAIERYGYSSEEFLSMSMKDLRPEEDIDKYVQLAKTGVSGMNTFGPWRHIKKNGEILYVDVYAYYTNRKGEKVAFVMAVDVTQRVKYEQQVTELNHTLEQKIKERTREYIHKNSEVEVANEKLTTLNEALKSANKQLASANDLIARQSELLVKQREEKLNDILSTIQDVVWSASFSDRELLFINEAAWQVFGYSQEELYQESRILEQIVYSHDKKRLEKAFKELIDKGYVHAEYRIVHKSGIIRWIRNQVWLKNEPLSQTATMDGVVTDITERKNYEAELQKRERLLNSLIESQTNYLIRTDIEGRYTFANQQFLQKFSFLPEEIIGQPFSKTVIPEDVDNCQAMALECIHNPGKIVSLIIRKPDKAEGIFWTEWEFIGIQDETGKVVEIQGVGQDVTEKKKSEERLEESNQALKHAQQIAQIGNWEFDLPTGKITWSDQVFTIHQVSKDAGEPSLEKLFTLYHPDDIPVLQASVRALIEQAIPYNLDMRIIGPSSQEIIYVNVIGKPIKDKAGKVKRIYGTLLNINERKLFEKSLQHQNEQLKKINSELDKFVYSVSHSLRAPLTSVLGLINVIRIDKVDPQVNIYLGLIEKSILKLDETIQEINDYSRNARFGLNIREVDLQKLLQDIIEPYTSADRAAKIKIETSFQAAFPFYSDAERLKVVINNLLSNAVRYYDEAKACPLVMIRINITPEEAFIEVEDNGIGIDSQLTDKIFNMFFRASEKSTGSGLGLYIVKETVDKLKGNITVASEPGKGSMFTVQLANMHS